MAQKHPDPTVPDPQHCFIGQEQTGVDMKLINFQRIVITVLDLNFFLLFDGRIRIRTNNDGSGWPKNIRIRIHNIAL